METVWKFLLDIGKKGLSVLSALFLLIPTLVQGLATLPRDAKWQKNHIESLTQSYAQGLIEPVDEASIFDGNLDEALKNGIRFNEMSFLATHNSYERKSVLSYELFSNSLSVLVPDKLHYGSGTMNMEPLTDQLNVGIRSFELDVEAYSLGGKEGFRCLHNPGITMTTNCYDFSLALQEISMWSDNNPGHLPITIILEPKMTFVPIPGYKFFKLEHAQKLDELFRSELGDKLLTPADMLRDYESFGDMRATDDWMKVEDMLGKVMVLLHFTTGLTQEYIALDPSIHAQAMFPTTVSSEASKSYASFVIVNDPNTAAVLDEDLVRNKKLIVRTRVDAHPTYSKARRETAMNTHSQILSTDFPIRTNPIEGAYTVSIGENKTVRSVK